MHELGHTLNLWHGGAPGAENYKPNYYSIMNYSYDYLPRLSDGKAILDYSRSTRSVDERSLNEVTSLPNPPYGLIGKDDGGLVRIPIIGNSVDWNLNGSVDSASFAQDLNGDGSLSFLGGNTDWIVGVVPGTIMFKAGSIGQTSNAALRAPQRNEVDVEAPTAPDSTRFFFEDWDPVASFEASKVIGLGPLSVAFDASTSTDPDGLTSDLTYEWNFGDGSPAGEGVNPTHVFTTPGIYQVELGVTDADGFENEAVATQNIEVKASNKPPVATFSADPTSSNPPSNVTFDATASTDFDGSLVNYAWDYGDGTTGSGVSGMHNYTTVGVRTVKLTVTDDNGATASTTQRVRIGVPNTPPVAAFASTLASGPTPLAVAVDGSTSTDSDGSIAAYEWDFGDGSAVVAGSSASHVFGTAGTFTIRLKVTDNEGATSEAARVVTATAAKAATAPAPTATSTPAVAVLGTSILAPLRFVGATARRASRGTSFRITLSGASASKQLVVVRRLAKVRTKSKGKWRTISVWKRVGSSYTNTGGAASFTIRTKLATGSTVRIDVAGQQRRLKVAKQVVVKKKASKARASRR